MRSPEVCPRLRRKLREFFLEHEMPDVVHRKVHIYDVIWIYILGRINSIPRYSYPIYLDHSTHNIRVYKCECKSNYVMLAFRSRKFYLLMDMLTHGFSLDMRVFELAFQSHLTMKNPEHVAWMKFVLKRYPNIIEDAQLYLWELDHYSKLDYGTKNVTFIRFGEFHRRTRPDVEKPKILTWREVRSTKHVNVPQRIATLNRTLRKWIDVRGNVRLEWARVRWAAQHGVIDDPFAIGLGRLPQQPICLVMAFI